MARTDTEIMDATEAAAFLKVGERTVRELARKGQLPARKVGKEWRFSRSGLIRWVNGGDSDQAYFWTEAWQQGEREAEEDIRAGRIYPLESPDDLDRMAKEMDD